MFSTITIISYISLISLVDAIPPKMSWCDYFYHRGIMRAECVKPKIQHWSLQTKPNELYKPVLSMPLCNVVTDWGRCQRADHCPRGLLCWVNGNPCCTPKNDAPIDNGAVENQCPTPKAMGIQCNTNGGVSWCSADDQCHQFSSLQRCCPTGCGYNICVRLSAPVDMHSRMLSLSVVPTHCPAMDALPLTCSLTHGVSWCEKDSHCLSNQAQTRHCCPTRCGYNVCVLQASANTWIIT